MEELFRKTFAVPSQAATWQSVGEPVPLERFETVAAAGLSDRAVQIRLLQGIKLPDGNLTWYRQSDASDVPANARGKGLLSACGFPWGQLQVLNESGQAASVQCLLSGVPR